MTSRSTPPPFWFRILKRVAKLPKKLWSFIKDFLPKFPRTLGERSFAAYLRENRVRYKFEKKWRGKKKNPDFTIFHKTGLVVAEVKDIDIDIKHEPHKPIREKINKAATQLREYAGMPTAVVMFSPGFSDAFLKTDFVMLGAMYGNYQISMPLRADGTGFDGDKAEWGFGEGGKMRHQAKPQNITLHQVKVGQAKLFEWHENHPDENLFDPQLQKKVDFKLGETRWGVIVWENEYRLSRFRATFSQGRMMSDGVAQEMAKSRRFLKGKGCARLMRCIQKRSRHSTLLLTQMMMLLTTTL